MMTDSDDDVLRLTAIIEHQRRALDRIRAAAAGEAVVAMARGALMERLGVSSAEAASQLAELAAATGIPLAEMAAAVLAPQSPGGADVARGGDVPGAAGDDVPGRGSDAAEAGDGASGVRVLMFEAAAELATDGAELAGTLAGQVLEPLGAAAVAL